MTGFRPLGGLPIAGQPALTARTIAADAGSFTITGTDASLEYGREVAAGAGSFALTGTDANLELGREIAADAGSFAVTGTDANLEFGREIAADAGSYALTGTDATLTKAAGRTVIADAGSFVITGTDANLEFGREIAADGGSYALTGTDAALQIATPSTQTTPPSYGGGGYHLWPEVSWLKKKKKPKKADLVEEVADAVEQAMPALTEDESQAVALRLVQQMNVEQLRRIQTLEAFIARVEAELAEMDDEEVLLLAA